MNIITLISLIGNFVSIAGLIVGLRNRKLKKMIEVLPFIDESLEVINVKVVNIGDKNVCINKITIGYGITPKKQKNLLVEEYEDNFLLQGRDYPTIFYRSDLVNEVKNEDNIREAYGLLWANAYLTTGERYTGFISIDSKIISYEGFFPSDKQYVATEEFLDFPQRDKLWRSPYPTTEKCQSLY